MTFYWFVSILLFTGVYTCTKQMFWLLKRNIYDILVIVNALSGTMQNIMTAWHEFYGGNIYIGCCNVCITMKGKLARNIISLMMKS